MIVPAYPPVPTMAAPADGIAAILRHEGVEQAQRDGWLLQWLRRAGLRTSPPTDDPLAGALPHTSRRTRSFTGTNIGGRHRTLPQLIALIVQRLLRAAEEHLGPLPATRHRRAPGALHRGSQRAARCAGAEPAA